MKVCAAVLLVFCTTVTHTARIEEIGAEVGPRLNNKNGNAFEYCSIAESRGNEAYKSKTSTEPSNPYTELTSTETAHERDGNIDNQNKTDDIDDEKLYKRSFTRGKKKGLDVDDKTYDDSIYKTSTEIQSVPENSESKMTKNYKGRIAVTQDESTEDVTESTTNVSSEEKHGNDSEFAIHSKSEGNVAVLKKSYDSVSVEINQSTESVNSEEINDSVEGHFEKDGESATKSIPAHSRRMMSNPAFLDAKGILENPVSGIYDTGRTALPKTPEAVEEFDASKPTMTKNYLPPNGFVRSQANSQSKQFGSREFNPYEKWFYNSHEFENVLTRNGNAYPYITKPQTLADLRMMQNVYPLNYDLLLPKLTEATENINTPMYQPNFYQHFGVNNNDMKFPQGFDRDMLHGTKPQLTGFL